MRKRYLFLLMLLFPLATILSSSRAYAQTDAEYNAALAAIEDGASYYVTTVYGGVKYYLTPAGNLTDSEEEAGLFEFRQTGDGGFKTYGYCLDGGTGNCFSNPVSDQNINDTKLNTHTISDFRSTWDVQVFFFNADGKFAVRATNAAYASSSWGWVGSSFWTVKVGSGSNVPYIGYSFDVNFIWVLEDEEGYAIEPPADAAKVYATLVSIVKKYEVQLYDDEEGSATNIGSDFGQYSDKDSWDELYLLLWEINELVEGSFDPDNNYEWIGDGECPTLDEAMDMVAKADELYNNILESIVPYTMPQDGYYRIIANLLYTKDKTEFVEKAIAASYSKDHQNKGVYETLDRSKGNFLWKLTKSESGDSIMIQNAGMGTYLSFSSPKENRLVMTEDEADASYVMFDYAGLDPVDSPDQPGMGADEKHIFYIRLASGERGGNYVHQLGHGEVKDAGTYWGHAGKDTGTEQELCFWAATHEKTSTDKGTSEWYLEYVSDDEAEEILEAFEKKKEHDLLVVKNNELRAKVLEDLTMAKDDVKTALITSADQMSSPYSQNDCGGRDGGDLSAGVLIDGDASTYWHSAYNGTVPEGLHYIQLLDMQDMVGNCELYFRERSGANNDRPSEFTIKGSETPDGNFEDWEDIVVLAVPNFAAGAENSIPFTVEKAYPYIRIAATNTDNKDNSFRTYWHAAELQIYTVRPNPNSQYVALGEIAVELENIYIENIAIADEDITDKDYDALYKAYRAFLGGMVDPTELRNALTTYANLTKSVVEGSEPGQWSRADIATAYDNLYNEVKEYDEAGRYSEAQNHRYAVMLKAMSKSVMEQANGIKTDVWYHITFPTEEMYTDYGFDPKSPGGNSKIVDNPDQWGYYVASGIRTDEMGIDQETNEEKATGNYILESVGKDDVREGMSMYFINPDDIEDPDVSMFRFIEREQDKANYTDLFSELKENIGMALDMSTTYTKGEALITDASQLSSNASDSSEGLHIENLVDGNPSTFWHSDYHSQVLEPGYIQVALNEPVSGLIQIDVTRRQNASNGHIVRMYIQGSTDAQNWTNVGYIETPFTSQNESVTSAPVDLDGTYSYLRFILTNRYGTDGGGNTEFDPFAEITNKNEYNKKWTYFHAAEFQIYPVTANKQLTEKGTALLQALKVANKVILKDATVQDYSNVYQAYRDYQDEFNINEGKAILPKGSDKIAPTYAIQNKATGLFINCKGANNANNSLELIPTFFDYKAIGFQRSLIHAVNIDGTNCSYLHSQNFDHRFVTWNAVTANSNSALVIREAEPVEPAEFTFYKSIKPGEIYNWCNAVSITNQSENEGIAYKPLGKFEIEDEGVFLALKQIETIEAGQPAFYIYGDTTEYDADDDYVEFMEFTMPAEPDFVLEGATVANGILGNIVNHTLVPGEIYFSENGAFCTEKTGTYVTGNSVVVSVGIVDEVDPDGDYDFSICLAEAADAADGLKDVSTTIHKISQPGAVYSMDGKLLRTNATLNSLKSLGKGMYILNGVKVLVK